MITEVTLNAINDDLDAERMAADVKRVSYAKTKTSHRNGKKNSKLNIKVQIQFKSTSGSDTVIRKIDPECTEQMISYKRVISLYGLFGFFFGTKISYDWKPKSNLMYWLTTLLLSFTVFTFLYTIYYHFHKGDYFKILEPFGISGIMASCILKWHGFLKHFRSIYSLIFFPRELCLKNVTGHRADIIDQGLRKTCTVLKTYTVGVVALLCFFVAVPVKFFVFNDLLIPLAPLEIIFVDQSTTKGILIATLLESILGFFSGAATVMYGSGFLICICNYNFLVDLVKLDLMDLDEMWNGSSETSVQFRHAYLHNICTKTQDMKRYLKVVEVIYETKLFLYFLAVYLSQAICLYEITENDWIPGYTIALMLFVEMMFYCLVGTQISIGDDKLCDMVYAANWHTYDLASQRVIQMLLHECQQPKVLKVGTLGPLSVVTGHKEHLFVLHRYDGHYVKVVKDAILSTKIPTHYWHITFYNNNLADGTADFEETLISKNDTLALLALT